MITKQQVNHVSRLIKQNLNKPDFAIIGGYHGVNLGDIALGESVKFVLKDLNLKGGLQTIYNIDKWPWPKTKYTIIGGGAIGYASSLIKLKNRLSGNYSKLAFLGVDFNEFEYSDEILKMLKEAVWISCRNEFQAHKLQEITGRKDISFNPDLVFSYRRKECEELRKSKKEKTLLVNVVPLYGSIKNNEFVPIEKYREERPELYKSFDLMIQSYKEGVQSVIKKALSEGYKVETIPFTPADATAAKILLEDLPVKHNAYDENVYKMTKKIGSAQRIFATRYHATILGIKTGAELIPMAYATKNDKLLNELGVDDSKFISSINLAEGINIFPEPFKINDDLVKQWENASAETIKKAIKKMQAN